MVLMALGFWLNKKKSRSNGSHKNFELTVLIPFRNEAENIKVFLNQIEQQTLQPKKWIFINDHSTDNWQKHIDNKPDNVFFLELPEQLEGKKKALAFGMEKVETEWVLTMDADITFSKKYIETLSKIPKADMVILPVRMKGKGFQQLFFEPDVLMVNALNNACSGFFRPILASGANLLFKVSSYKGWSNLETHAHISSGDDVFLLRDFLKNKGKINVVNVQELIVETPTPITWSAFLNQRVRWISKSTKTGDLFAEMLGLVQLIIQVVFYLLLFQSAFNGNWLDFSILVFTKSLFEIVGFSPYFFSLNAHFTLFLLPIYQFFYPILNVIIILKWMFGKSDWKGRIAIQSK